MANDEKLLSPLSTSGIFKYSSFVFHRLYESAVWTFAELGIADFLANSNEPVTASILAENQGWNSECLYRLLRLLSSAGIVNEIESDEKKINEPEKSNRFQLTDDGRYLTSDHPSKARYLLRWELSPLMKSSSNYLPHLVKYGYEKGNGLDQITGNRPMFEYLGDHQNHDISHSFNEAMTYYSNYSAQSVTEIFDFSIFNRVVDIGGNLGILLSHILAHYPTIGKGICFDLAHIVEQPTINREFERQKIPKERYEFASGDMFDAKTIPEGDLYIMQNIIHDWNDQRCIEILKAIRTAAKGKAITLLIIGFIILNQTNNNQKVNWCSYALDLHMMTILTAKERTQEQHQYLLEKAGFTLKDVHLTNSPITIIEATTNH